MTEVFLCRIPNISDNEFSGLLNFVSPERRDKVLRLKQKDKQKQSLFAGLLLNKVLCNRLNTDSGSLSFAVSDKGKPYLLNHRNIEFSISHTDGLVAVALSDKAVGIDIEKIRPVDLKISERFFSKADMTYIFNGETDKAERFFEVWTKKEAVAKHSGEGLADNFKCENVLSDATVKTFVEDGYAVSVCYDGGEIRIYNDCQIL